jgi:D-lyxose ketol-isomerase
VREIFDLGLGWDITDFGTGNFKKTGLLLFTIRNGKLNSKRYPKAYAEKIMIVEEEQVTPMHFHWNKMEDIINRGGGNLLIQLYGSTKNEGLSQRDITVSIDGHEKVIKAGGTVQLTPGQSITLPQGLYHRFYGERKKGTVMVGEVSMVNDDNMDNRFLDAVGRFPAIEEDEPPKHLLCTDYRALMKQFSK